MYQQYLKHLLLLWCFLPATTVLGASFIHPAKGHSYFSKQTQTTTTILKNFLDDYKNDASEDGDSSSSNSFPPPICPSEIYKVRFSTTAGDFTICLDRALSPSGVTRFLDLVNDGFFHDQYLYRVEPGFVIQFGVASNPDMQAKWDPDLGGGFSCASPLPDEPNRDAFRQGSLSFAGSGVDSRSCHFFIALEPGSTVLGNAPHETVLGHIESEDGGLMVLENLIRNREEQGHGDLLGMQESLLRDGNSALDAYPGVDKIIACGRIS